MGPRVCPHEQCECSEKGQSVKPSRWAGKMFTIFELDLTKGQVKSGKREVMIKSVTAYRLGGKLVLQHS